MLIRKLFQNSPFGSGEGSSLQQKQQQEKAKGGWGRRGGGVRGGREYVDLNDPRLSE